MDFYVVTRRDLSPRVQVTQICRMLLHYGCRYLAAGESWFTGANALRTYVVPDEAALSRISQKALALNIRGLTGPSPAVKNERTALVLEASAKTRKLVARLPRLPP